MRRRFMFAGAVAVVAVAGSYVPASAQVRQQSGTLSCNVAGGVGFIIGSEKQVQCVYRPDGPGRPEAYAGRIKRFGLDIGATAAGQMVWAVLTQSNLRQGALAGVYSGPSGEATVGAGLGANLLVGGSNQSVALQPLSIQAQTGLNVAVGIAGLELAPVAPTAVRQARVRAPRARASRVMAARTRSSYRGRETRVRTSRVRPARISSRTRVVRERPVRNRMSRTRRYRG